MFDARHTPVVLRGAVADCAPGWSWNLLPAMREPSLNLWLIASGRGEIVSGGRAYELKSGECFLLRMWDAQRAQHDPQRPLLVPFVLFDLRDERGTNLLPDRLDPPAIRYRVRDVSFLQRVIERTLRAHREGRADDASRWLRAALGELDECGPARSQTPLQAEQAARVEDLCARILQAPGARRSLADLARAAHYSRDHLIRVFKKHKGITPNEFVLRARMDRARTLLHFSDHTVAEIAEQLGYADPYRFSHQFKARMGVCPTAFRAARPLRE